MWGYRGQWWWFPFFSFISVLSLVWVGFYLFVWEVFGFWRVNSFICSSCFVFSKCTICLLARWGGWCREAKLNPSNISSHPLPCCSAECESRGCFVSFHASNPNIHFQHPDAGCLWASSPFLQLEGRHRHITIWLLGLSLPRKMGCSYPQCLCQCPVWHLSFVLVQYRLVGFMGVFQASLPSTLYGFFLLLLYALFQKLHVLSSLQGYFLFGFPYLPWTP